MRRMDDQGPELKPPPEAVLVRRRRMAAGLTVQAAAQATEGSVSHRRWTQIEQGFVLKGGRRVRTTASDQALAHMGAVVEARPDELTAAGRPEAAEVLQLILDARVDHERARARRDGDIVRQMADYFEDESVPPDEKRRLAEKFLTLFPYYIAGQRPPRGLLDDDDPPNGSARSA